MFFSTRDASLTISASQAIIKGISDDGGLFLPKEIKKLPYEKLINSTYPEIAYSILREYLDDFSDVEIKEAVKKAYGAENFPEKITGLTTFGDFSFLELFHGRTLTFKDMALSLLPFLMEEALKKHPEEKSLHILTATSGDTGSAVLSSFRNCQNISVSVLYPDGGISYIQEKQMLSFTSPTERAYALQDSNFDDCQALVKKLLVEKPYGLNYTSANSINIGRLLPQIVYYYYSYISLVKNGTIKPGELIDVVVPTGNFGDIFAAYLAKKMSLPLNKLVVASNANRILTDFFSKGVYDTKRDFIKTNSPSMDILISSNLERLLYLTCLNDKTVQDLENDLRQKGSFKVSEEFLKKLQMDFLCCSSSEEETLQGIKDCEDKYNYLIDPHTSVAYQAYQKIKTYLPSKHSLIVSTASPLKFPLTIARALNIEQTDDLKALKQIILKTKISVPSQLEDALNTPSPKYLIKGEEFKEVLYPTKHHIFKVPASSANLGPGFDVAGLALSLFNTFSFQKNKEDILEGFIGEEELKDNLVLKSYRRFFEEYHLPYQPVRIKMLNCLIPLSRGLGSSAACIIAGLIGANEICNRLLEKKDLLDLATKIEGHPDNVACCLLGGLVCSFKNSSGKLVPLKYPVNPNLKFVVLVPEQEFSTKIARSALLASYPLADITFDASRLVNLPLAFQTGDTSLLYELLSDKIHIPYRLPLIEEGSKIMGICQRFHIPFTISGAGSSLLVILREDQKEELSELEKAIGSECVGKWQIKELSICQNGVKEEEKVK
ncbi:MAG: threonine synthase [Bacilli bacterium]|jgi:threonine synthase|nr:threonine synthase [Bacilli bacterium]